MDLPALAEEMRLWNQHHAAPLKGQIIAHDNDRDPDRRLRIGYVSPDFYAHVSEYFLDPLLKNHDHKKFEIVVYADVRRPDESTKRFEGYADLWHLTYGMDDQTLADRIRQDKIDVLVDLKLHTVGNRLLVFARKPAPVQTSWLGYPGTTGLDTMDWRLSDRFLEPPEGPATVAAASAERAAYLPDCFWCYDPMASEPSVNALPAKTAGFITFGSLNTFGKINDMTLELWLATLKAVARSRLLLLAPPGSARRRVSDKFRAAGVDANRLEFLDRLPRPRYLRTYQRIDICLDTYPCSGHTTSFDALWMGVPVVSLVSPTVMGRATFSQLSNLNFQELAALRPEDFVSIAAKLAGDLPRLAELREGLRKRMVESPLMDGPRFARGVEAAYRQIWKNWVQSPG
jgi:predicted O-linked N-acetylglucosamine transferase (SPINDLY family)